MAPAALPASTSASSAGELYAFGSNYDGQLGNATNNGTYNANPSPALVSLRGATGPVVQAAAGYGHSLVTSTGQLYAFGDNTYGQLGISASSGSYPNPSPGAGVAAGRDRSGRAGCGWL
jgi:alpha-tubulin suppressor-like RCC1 family protein